MTRRESMAAGVVLGWTLRQWFQGQWSWREFVLARKLQDQENKSLAYKHERDKALRILVAFRDNLSAKEGHLAEALRTQMKDWLRGYRDSDIQEQLPAGAINVISSEFSSRLVKLLMKEPDASTSKAD